MCAVEFAVRAYDFVEFLFRFSFSFDFLLFHSFCLTDFWLFLNIYSYNVKLYQESKTTVHSVNTHFCEK